MNTETAKILCKLNNDFYRSQANSFSETRKAPWEGWRRILFEMQEVFRDKDEANILDFACGNLRFVDFLHEEYPQSKCKIFAVDDCDDLVGEKEQVIYQSLDIIDALLEGSDLSEAVVAPCCDVTVCFGFMHHVPSSEYREKVLRTLIDKTQAGGYIAISFWEFLNNEDLAKKARITHEKACRELQMPPLDEGDYLLGWKNTPGVYRYCHHFSEDEISWLVEKFSDTTKVVARFLADGRTGNLNSYVLLRKDLQ